MFHHLDIPLLSTHRPPPIPSSDYTFFGYSVHWRLNIFCSEYFYIPEGFKG